MAGYGSVEPNEVYLRWQGETALVSLSIDTPVTGSGWEINAPYDLWCTIQIESRYSHNTTLTITAEQNPTESIRVFDAEIYFNGEYVDNLYIEQEAGYGFSVVPTSLSYGANGGNQQVSLLSGSGLRWVVESKPDWITTSISNNSLMTVTAAGNTSTSSRSGNIVVKCGFDYTETISVTQAGAVIPDTTSISKTSVTLGNSNGSTDTITLTSNYNAEWSTYEEIEWCNVSISNNNSKSATLTVTATVANNGTNTRSGTLYLYADNGDEYTISVTQNASNPYSNVYPNYWEVKAEGGTVTADLTANWGASWATQGVPYWISANITKNYTNNAVLTLTISANNGVSERTGKFTVKNDKHSYTVSVVQETNGYTYNISPTSHSFVSGGGTKSSTITSNGNGTYSVHSKPDWCSVSFTDNGTDKCTVKVTANAITSTNSRSETIYINTNDGQLLYINVSQEGLPKTTSINKSSLTIGCENSSKGNITLNANYNAEWKVEEEIEWCKAEITSNNSQAATLTITSTAENGGINDRSGNITINADNGDSYTISITQSGSQPYSNVHPQSFNVKYEGDEVQADLISNWDASWSTQGVPSWISTSITKNYSNNAVLNISITENTQALGRESEFTIKNDKHSHTITITQDGAGYSYDINPTSLSYGCDGGTKTSTITTNGIGTFSVKSNPDWCTVTFTNNSTSSTIVNVKASVSDTTDTRSGDIKITCNDGQELNISVYQEGIPKTTSINKSSLTLGSGNGSNGSITLSANYNAEWRASEEIEWCSTEIINNNTNSASLKITTIVENGSINDRSGFVIVKVDNGDEYTIEVIQSGSQPYSNVYPKSFEVKADGDTITATLQANWGANWSVSSKPSWVSTSISNNYTNNAILNITINANADAVGRSSDIEIINDYDNFTISITQEGAGYIYNINPTSLEYNYLGETKSLSLTANGDATYTIYSKPDWCEVEFVNNGTREVTLFISVGENKSVIPRSEDIRITPNDGYDVLNCTLSQEGTKKVTEITPTSLSVGSGETSDKITLTANYDADWVISTDNVEWLEVDIINIVSSKAYITVSTSINYDEVKKSANVYISADNGDEYTVKVSKAAGYRKFELDITAINKDYNGGDENITLMTNYPTTPKIDNKNDWFSVSVTKVDDYTHTIKVNVSSTDKADLREGTFRVYDDHKSAGVSVKQTGAEKWYKVEPKSVRLRYNGKEEGLIRLLSNWNSGWTYNYECDWLEVSQSADEGKNYNNTLILKPDFNEGVERRTIVKAIKKNNPNIEEIVYVIQDEFEHIFFLLEVDTILFPYKGGTQYVRILKRDNVDSIIVNGNDWCTATLADDYIKITVPPYAGNREMEVTITAKNDDSSLSTTIKVYQMDGKMVSIWKDYFVNTTSTEDSIMYNVTKNGALIYTGMLHKNPETKDYNIYINDIVSNYLNNKFIFSATTNYSFVMEDYVGLFGIVKADGTAIANDYYFNDWSYSNYIMDYSGDLVPLRDNVNDIIDSRQYFIQSFLNKNRTATKTANNGISSVVVQPAQAITMVSKNPANGVDLSKQCYTTLTSAGKTYKVMNTGKEYCIYYKNAFGGYDWLVVDGITIPSSSYKKNVYRQRANNNTISFSKVNYQNDITDKIQFNTGFLKDDESKRMENLFTSTEVYVHNLKTGEIKAGVITDTSYTNKTYKNQGCKYFNYTFNIELSNMRLVK